MNHITKEQFNASLEDVRKAYRLLYLYQRRIMDTAKYISDVLGRNIQGGYPLYSNNTPPEGTKYRTDNWSWDWLNMYMYEFLIINENIAGAEIKFAFAIQSDTGFFDVDNIKQTDVMSFAPVEKAASRGLFYIGKNTWKPKLFAENKHSFAKQQTNECIERDTNGIFLGKAYPLEDFIDENIITTSVRNFQAFCHQNGVTEFKIP